MTRWMDDYDDDDSSFCECGVTLLDGEDECSVCAGAPHGRECPCDLCEAYWQRIAEESRVAAERANRALVCTCGWTGPFIEHHRDRRPDCVVSHREEATHGAF